MENMRLSMEIMAAFMACAAAKIVCARDGCAELVLEPKMQMVVSGNGNALGITGINGMQMEMNVNLEIVEMHVG